MSMVEFTGQTYGEGARQQASQRMVPPGPPPTDAMGPFDGPTERPDEPVTAGLPMGPGPGPEALTGVGIQSGSKLDLALQVRAIASRYPNPALLALLQELEN